MKREIFYTLIIAVAFFALGLVAGMLLQQVNNQATLVAVASNLNGVQIDINLNETLMMDRATENVKEMLWDIRMENCTRTEKHYCALECYENNKLIPCENFTGTEVFCNEGICRIDGVCPDYFEILEGKTLEDCIKEVEEGK